MSAVFAESTSQQLIWDDFDDLKEILDSPLQLFAKRVIGQATFDLRRGWPCSFPSPRFPRIHGEHCKNSLNPRFGISPVHVCAPYAYLFLSGQEVMVFLDILGLSYEPFQYRIRKLIKESGLDRSVLEREASTIMRITLTQLPLPFVTG